MANEKNTKQLSFAEKIAQANARDKRSQVEVRWPGRHKPDCALHCTRFSRYDKQTNQRAWL
jgi:hypothetical protein